MSTPMTEIERDEYIAKGGEFGMFVAQLAARALDAETRADTLQTTVHLQEAQLLKLQKRLANAEAQRDDAIRDVALMIDSETKIAGIIRETRAQRVSSPHAQHEPRLTGAPMHPRELAVVRGTAADNAARDRSAG